MIRFLDTTATIPFSVSSDTEETKTIFRISPLTSQELQVINDASTTTESNGVTVNLKVKTSLRNRLIVQLGLRGWENAGQEFKSEQRSILGMQKREVITEELLNALPIDYVNELGEKIQEISLSAGIDKKN